MDSPAADEASQRRAKRRRVAIVVATAIVIPLLVVAADAISRPTLFRHVKWRLIGTYAVGALLSMLVWGLGLEAARHPRRGVRVAVLAFLAFTASFGIGGQAFFRGITNGYVNRDAVLLALGIREEVTGYLAVHAPRAAAFFLIPPIVVALYGAARARRLGPLAWRPTLVVIGAVLVTGICMFGRFRADWEQCLPPDVLWLHGSGGPILLALGIERPPKTLPPGRHEALPDATPVRDDAPSIVVLLGESVRRDEVCLPHQEGCTLTPNIDAAAPDRIAFRRAMAIASCTELVSVALWSGLPIDAQPADLAHAPLVWDWAKARGYRTAYISSQNLLFQNLGLFLQKTRIDYLREARDRDPAPNIDLGTPDELSTGDALEFLAREGRPALVVVHFSNTHLPYRQVPGFTPYPTKGIQGMDERRNAYRNAVRHNDFVIGEFVKRLRQTDRGKKTIVVSLSDHGEAWMEHGAQTHSFDVYSETIEVPVWIDAPPGTLPEAAVDRLRREAPTRPVFTIDLSATLFDLLGGFDEPALRAQAARFAGTSLLRDPPGPRDVLLWNCAPTRPCVQQAFGVVRWPMKLQYVGREWRYACHDIEADPTEVSPLPPERCAELRVIADRVIGPQIDLDAELAKRKGGSGAAH